MIIRNFALATFSLLSITGTAFADTAMREVPTSKSMVMASYAPIVKKAAPSVVNIYTKRVVQQQLSPFMADPFFQQFFGRIPMQGLTREQVQSSLGSGVIVDSSGVVVTNAHVVKDAQEIMVVLNDGREYEAKASLVDKHSDIAILRIEAKGESLPFSPLKASEGLEVGDIVIAIGNPFGVGQTVTSGIVSALARSSLNINDYNFFIQTDAAINPGNSGGPLLDLTGSIVGINTAIYSSSGGSLGIGFAVPSEMVATVLAAEKSGTHSADGGIPRAWLGISGQQVTADIAKSLGLARPRGVMITNIHALSPFKTEGLKVGDVVTSINGHEIRDAAELKFRLATLPLGTEAAIETLHKGNVKTYSVKAITPPDSPERDQQTLRGNHPLGGAIVANINPAVASELNLSGRESGVVVAGIDASGSASRLMQVGDILLELNGQTLKTVKDLKKAMTLAQSQGAFDLTIERAGQKTRIVLR